MNDKDARIQEKRFRKLFNKWRQLLLPGWSLHLTFKRSELPSNNKNSLAPGFATVLSIASEWIYKEANLTVSLLTIANLSDYQLESLLVHELIHPIVNEMQEPKDRWNHEERTVTELELAINRITHFYFNCGLKKGKQKSKL